MDKELDICPEVAYTEIVQNINPKSIKKVENNEFEIYDKNDSFANLAILRIANLSYLDFKRIIS
ncbi:hypothetical protein HZS_2276 [Henneguya salminicola]|nr:hypothetical protein HZS_2276 [Henneguya salminicola]